MNYFSRALLNVGLFFFKGVHDLDKYGGVTSGQKETLRPNVKILVVDDQDASSLATALSKFGYKNVTPMEEMPEDSVVQQYPIVITDVSGVGKDVQSNGLRLAKHIKSVYPLKQVIIASGQLMTHDYDADRDVLKLVDGVFSKGDPNDKLADLVEACLQRIYNPATVWRNVRKELLNVEREKTDASIDNIAKYEDQFVRHFISLNRGKQVEPNWIEMMVRAAKLAEPVVKLLIGIKGGVAIATAA